MGNSLPSTDKGAMALLPDTTESEFGNLGWLRWWYRLSLPAKPEEGATFKKQDIYRRARLASILLLLMLVIMTCALLVSLLSRNILSIAGVAVVMVILIFAVGLNRVGQLVFEGLLIIGLWTIGIVLSFVAQPALSIDSMIQYDLLTIAILLAVTFFPAWSVFLVALFNCVFVVVSINMLKHDAMLGQLIAQEGVAKVVTRPISLTIVIMVITYLWAQSSYYSLQRADRAEMIARLQYDLAERDHAISVQKVQLEHSIQRIIDVLTSYSNGNVSSRVPLTQDNVLWNVAGSINNLLNRVQRTRHVEVELDRTRILLQQVRQENAALRAALQNQPRTDLPSVR